MFYTSNTLNADVIIGDKQIVGVRNVIYGFKAYTKDFIKPQSDLVTLEDEAITADPLTRITPDY